MESKKHHRASKGRKTQHSHIKVTGIKRQEVDIELLARAYLKMADRIVREKAGKPPLTREQQAYSDALYIRVAAESKRSRPAIDTPVSDRRLAFLTEPSRRLYP